MQLSESLSHMPFLDGTTMIFCVSAGVGSFAPKLTAFDILHKVTPRVTNYQQWTPVIKRGAAEAVRIDVPYPMDTPNRVYCNPVLSGNEMSVCYNRALLAGTLVGNKLTEVKQLYSGIFTGYKIGTRMAIGKVACAGGSQLILSDGVFTRPLMTIFDFVLRIVPYKAGNIITGKQGSRYFTVYLDGDNVAQRLTVKGLDIYKSYLTEDGEMAIYAVRAGGFEERYLHSDLVTLVPMPEFVR